MRQALRPYIGSFQWHGDPVEGVYELLSHHDRFDIIGHEKAVARTARRIAAVYGIGDEKIELAAALHDVSALIPDSERLAGAAALDIPMLQEERQVPLLLHQKLSAVIAREWLNVTDGEVLSAVACHTTLKAGASPLDLLLFIADKLSWDRPGEPPYRQAMERALMRSMEEAALCYLRHLLSDPGLLAPHPWMIRAFRELSVCCGQ